MSEDIPPLFSVLALLLLLMLGSTIFAMEMAQNGSEGLIRTSQLFVKPSSSPYFHVIVYEELIDCLIKYESGGNPDAVGDSGKANGILQFHKPTFQHHCVDKHRYEIEDYKNPTIQMECTDRMLIDDFSSITNWSVYPNCI